MTDQQERTAPIGPDEFPPELQDALRRMSNRGPVVDLATGQRVAEEGRLRTDPQVSAEFGALFSQDHRGQWEVSVSSRADGALQGDVRDVFAAGDYPFTVPSPSARAAVLQAMGWEVVGRWTWDETQLQPQKTPWALLAGSVDVRRIADAAVSE
jgi:hypothetical protein